MGFNSGFKGLNKKYTSCYLKCIVYGKFLKPRQSYLITLYNRTAIMTDTLGSVVLKVEMMKSSHSVRMTTGKQNCVPAYIQRDATLHSLFISGNCSTCFGCYFHPSSGAHTTLSTASGICQTVTATYR